MGTNNVSIRLFKTPEEAPNYSLPDFKAASLEEAVIVRNGTELMQPTVDLIFVDENGQKYVALITMNLLKMICGGR